MSVGVMSREGLSSWARERLFLGQPYAIYLKQSFTPFNVTTGLIALTGLAFIIIRFWYGLGAVTGASQDQPWGLFLSWGLFSGVPLSATGFVLASVVYLFGLKDYHPVVKNAILLGFLGYFFAVVFLIIDLGRPWRLPYPMVMSFGTASVLFLIAWHVALYLTCQLVEFSPSIFEWGGWKKLKHWAAKLTISGTILGVILSTLHQSALGAMYLLAPGKLHPLWYTPYLPILFLVSAIVTGVCVVIFVTYLTQRFFRKQADANYLNHADRISYGLGSAVPVILFTYLALKIVTLAHGNHWGLLATPYGYLYLVETIGFVLVPCIFFVVARRQHRVGLMQFAALVTVIGTVLNRLNVLPLDYKSHAGTA